jgi:hypothetical protein
MGVETMAESGYVPLMGRPLSGRRKALALVPDGSRVSTPWLDVRRRHVVSGI